MVILFIKSFIVCFCLFFFHLCVFQFDSIPTNISFSFCQNLISFCQNLMELHSCIVDFKVSPCAIVFYAPASKDQGYIVLPLSHIERSGVYCFTIVCLSVCLSVCLHKLNVKTISYYS